MPKGRGWFDTNINESRKGFRKIQVLRKRTRCIPGNFKGCPGSHTGLNVFQRRSREFQRVSMECKGVPLRISNGFQGRIRAVPGNLMEI